MDKPATRATVNLQPKTLPTQDRSRQTYEAILAAAAGLLEDVGIDRFSTNLICQRAQLTPPALYRYFPNKFALLKELGVRLMAAQDEVVFAWLDNGGLDTHSVDEAFRRNIEIHTRVIEVTRSHPASLWILRALRAVPTMLQVRIDSHAQVAERLFYEMSRRFTKADHDELRRTVRLNLELSSALIELVLEDPTCEPAETIAAFSRMTAEHFYRFD